MNVTADDKLAIAAAKLERAVPNQWNEFKDAFAELSDAKRGEVVRAPADQVFVAQGRAQQCDELLTLFADALKKAERLAAAKPK